MVEAKSSRQIALMGGRPGVKAGILPARNARVNEERKSRP
jgi:hypothetical protein